MNLFHNSFFDIQYVRDHYRVSKKNSEQGVPKTKHCFITKISYLRDDKEDVGLAISNKVL